MNNDTQTNNNTITPVNNVLPNTSPAINTIPASTVVNASSLNATQPLNLPATPAPVIPSIPLSMADKAVQATQTQLTDTQKLQENTIDKQLDAILNMNALGTEDVAKQEELKKLNYTQKLQEYQNLNSSILQKQAEINKSDIELANEMRNLERRDTLLPFAQIGQAKLRGDASIMRALKTAEIGVLNAQVLAKQGDIELAKQTAEDAVKAKFAPYKAQIQAYTDILKAIDPILSRDEKKQANEQELRGKIALNEIDKLSKFQSSALSSAISNNAPQSILNAINNAQSIDDITKVGSNWIISKADKLDMALKNAQLAKINTEITPQGNYIVNNNQYTKEQYTAGEQAGNIKTILSSINNLVKKDQGFKGAVGAGFQKLPVVNWFVGDDTSKFGSGTDARTFDLKVQQLKNALALPNLSSLKGAMSDKDILFLKNIATSLDTGMTEKEFKKELVNIDNSLSSVEKKYGIYISDFVTPEVNLNDWAESVNSVYGDTNSNAYGYK